MCPRARGRATVTRSCCSSHDRAASAGSEFACGSACASPSARRGRSSDVWRCEVCASAGAARSRTLEVTLENLGDLIETRVVDVVLSARGRASGSRRGTRGAAWNSRDPDRALRGSATWTRARARRGRRRREAELQAAAVIAQRPGPRSPAAQPRRAAARSPSARSCTRPARRAHACRSREGRCHAGRTWGRS